jgi:hypothetical protein
LSGLVSFRTNGIEIVELNVLLLVRFEARNLFIFWHWNCAI